jgi:hypothetical protein
LTRAPKYGLPDSMGSGAARAWVLWLVALLCAASCAREDVELADPAEPEARVAAPDDAGAPAAPQRAARVFDHALCSCTSATFAGGFVLDAFDSSAGAYAAGEAGADVGIDDELATTAAVDVRGALIAAGSGLLAMTNGPVRIEGNVETNAGLAIVSAQVEFGRDLWVNGEIQAVGGVSVAGDVYQPASYTGAEALAAEGDVYRRDFTVPQPCACGEGASLDVAAIVADGQRSKDNDAHELAGDALLLAAGTDRLELPCGRFAFAGGAVPAGSAVTARGSATLLVAGDLIVAGSLGADLPAGSVLDVFVSGNLVLADGAELGSAARPAALRVYVGGDADIVLPERLAFAANLYAPHASMFLTTEHELYGALFVEGYHSVVDQRLHYDRAVLQAIPDSACSVEP